MPLVKIPIRLIAETVRRNPALRASLRFVDVELARSVEAVKDDARDIVEDEYATQFASAGAYFGSPWSSSLGPVDLVDDGDFRDSFDRSEWRERTRRRSSGTTQTFEIESTHQKSGISDFNSFLAFLEDGGRGGSMNARMTGEFGGISMGGALRIEANLKVRLRRALRRAGWRGVGA